MRRRTGILSSEIGSGLVLADALEEHGYVRLGEVLSKKLRAIQDRSPGWAVGVPFLIQRVDKAIREIEQRQQSKKTQRPVSKRRRGEDPQFRAAYDWFRIYGLNAESAMEHARAERFFHTHGWSFEARPEDERYQDVYGRSAENAEIERTTNFVQVSLYDARGEFRDAIGFIEDIPSELRYYRAELMANTMPRLRPRTAPRFERRERDVK